MDFYFANLARREITVVSNELHRLAELSVLGRPPTVRAVSDSPGYRHNPILPILYSPPSRMAQLPCGLHMLGDMRVAATCTTQPVSLVGTPPTHQVMSSAVL